MPTKNTADHLMWSGSRYFDVFDPDPADVDLYDIACALSRIPRFNGCTVGDWSVAQHSLLCHDFAQEDDVQDRDLLATTLLHDSPEWVLGDLISPLKRHPKFAFFGEVEDRVYSVIASRFGLLDPIPASVKTYDMIALATEKTWLIPRKAGPWPGLPEAREMRWGLCGLPQEKVAEKFMRLAEKYVQPRRIYAH